MTDKLTQIPNIESLKENLEKISHPKLILIDLKEFQQLNLKYSDEAGDFVLCSFAKALEKFAKENEMLAFRVEEDEFALIKDMPFDLSKLEKLVFLVSDFIKAEEYTFNENKINIAAHIGLCLDQTNLLKKAKLALSVAQKEDQPFVTYSEFINRLLEEGKEEVCKLLQQSLANGTLTPYYQKIIDLDGNTIYNEMLLRNETKTSIQSPKLFLNIAHERGFYNDIVKLVSKKMVHDEGSKAINLSSRDLFDEELFGFLITTFKNTDTIFELQNDEYLKADVLTQKLDTIKENNIKICLDNITKASEITAFKKEHIDFVKVCGTLIRLLNLSQDVRSTCKDILETTKSLEAKSIATHINSNHSFEDTKKLGFDYYQGYFFGLPTSTFAV